MTNIIAIIVALGSIATLTLWLFKRYWSTDAKERTLTKKLQEIRKEMRQALLDGRGDDYDRLRDERKQLHEELSNLH